MPIVEKYTYLGFTHGRRFIDFVSMAEKHKSKANATLTHLESVGSGWPELLKLQIFKTFVRPIWEYGAAMMFQASKSATHLLEKLQETQDRALKWIINFGGNCPTKIGGLLGIPKVHDRFNALSANFVLHFRSSPPDSASYLFAKELDKLRVWSDAYMLPHLSRNCLFVEISTRAADRDVSFAHELKRYQIERACELSKLAKCVSKKARHPTGYDRVIRITDTPTRREAIRWRVGGSFINRRCGLNQFDTSHNFSRKCIYFLDCKLWRSLQIPMVSPWTAPLNAPLSFNHLDILLNVGLFDDFMNSTKRLSEILGGRRD